MPFTRRPACPATYPAASPASAQRFQQSSFSFFTHLYASRFRASLAHNLPEQAVLTAVTDQYELIERIALVLTMQ